ncbi:MAG: phosphomannomutase/phosphoglucomutase [Candidatus Omnitrophica bacterium]|nr:phosphomannomutase/phosphoglucomutase [Candidatus Omnitrophota bacterium]MCM8825229.1 phosphomannomutase/phosphoglucomutase [Candidatus Omnitrophota bacterium]
MSIFKACDIRGKYGVELTEEIAYKIGKAIGTVCRDKKIVVGGDLRISTPKLKQALTDGIISSGCNVLDINTVPTPVFYFALKHYSLNCGVQVTGSHNPPGDNGMKIVLGKSPITPKKIKMIQNLVESEKFANGCGNVFVKNPVGEYKNYIKAFFEKGNLRIVVDAGNGCWWKLAPEILGELGYQTVKLFCVPDGTFPNRHPNPAISKNIRELQKKVVETESDFGVAFDGDGDRAIFVDDRGNIIPADIAIIIYIRNILPNKKDMSVVHDIKCSQIVSDEIRKLGAVPIMEKSGHAFIKKRFLETGAAFAGEVSGHYFFKEIGGDDGLFATLMMAKIIEKNGALSEQIKSIKPYPITPDIRIFVEYPEKIIETLINHYPPEMINTLDGVRIQFEHGWALVRKSVTEPVLTMRFEGKTDQELERIKNEIFSLIPELKK